MNRVKEVESRSWILYLIIGVSFIGVFLHYVWNFTVDDVFVSFRYAKHLAEGHGLVWNIQEPPVEGYTNFLWVLILALVQRLELNPVIAAKIAGIVALLGIVYLYWVISRDVLRNSRTLGLTAFCASLAFLLANPATAVHTVSGLETMLYTFCLLGVTCSAYRLIRSSQWRACFLFAGMALTGSLLRPEAALVSIVLTVLVLLRGADEGKALRDKRYVLITFTVAYMLPCTVYMIFRLYYFRDLFPLPFYAKTVSHGSLFGGVYSFCDAVRYVAPYLIVVLIVVFQNSLAWGTEHRQQYAAFRPLLLVAFAALLSANVVYPISSLWMNYAQRFYYPSFVLIYLLGGISVAIVSSNMKAAWAVNPTLRRYGEAVAGILAVLVVLSANFAFMSDLREARKYGNRLPVAHIALGKALNQFSSCNLTVASADAGAIPFFSEWRHIDMAGLNNKFIARHGSATVNYVEKEHPELVVFISRDGKNLRHDKLQDPFKQFVQKHNYMKLWPIKWRENYFLLPFLDPDATGSRKIRKAVQKVSEASFKKTK